MADDFAPSGDGLPADDNWGATDVPGGQGDMQMTTIDFPEIKLFGKWSLSDIEVNDPSLVVLYSNFVWIFKNVFIGLYCC